MTGLHAPPAESAPHAENGGAENTIGAGIRTERLRQGMTLTQLAEAASLSPSALSQIERGVTDPSIGSLRRIASALGVAFFQFLMEREPIDPVVRKSQRRTINFPNRTLQYQLLTPNLRGSFEVLALDLAPGAASGDEALGHDSEECILVQEGAVEIEVAGTLYSLEAGDAISIQRNLPHRVVNRGKAPASILTIISPPNTF